MIALHHVFQTYQLYCPENDETHILNYIFPNYIVFPQNLK